MGTAIAVTIVHDGLVYAERVIEDAFKDFDRVEGLMSIFREDSEVSRLNRQGFLEDASEELLSVIKEAERIHRLTEGVFDISILPLIEYLDGRFLQDVKGSLDDVRDVVDQSLIIIDGRTVKFLKKGMKIVVNSLAKGFAVDLAVEKLKSNGVRHALVNAGGDIKTIGGKTDSEPWRIAIRDPFRKEEFVTILKIVDGAVATSGTYERRIAGGRLSHIINPRCIGEPEVVSSTVICRNAITADALATALCVMEPLKGIRLIDGLDDAEAILVTRDKKIVKSAGFSTYEDF
jgi:thiamine biosynthesis lipoprotein